jgi:hypothetical protein
VSTHHPRDRRSGAARSLLCDLRVGSQPPRNLCLWDLCKGVWGREREARAWRLGVEVAPGQQHVAAGVRRHPATLLQPAAELAAWAPNSGRQREGYTAAFSRRNPPHILQACIVPP